jgi:ribosomal protein S18 acetylase RimI-like enzyme
MIQSYTPAVDGEIVSWLQRNHHSNSLRYPSLDSDQWQSFVRRPLNYFGKDFYICRPDHSDREISSVICMASRNNGFFLNIFGIPSESDFLKILTPHQTYNTLVVSEDIELVSLLKHTRFYLHETEIYMSRTLCNRQNIRHKQSEICEVEFYDLQSLQPSVPEQLTEIRNTQFSNDFSFQSRDYSEEILQGQQCLFVIAFMNAQVVGYVEYDFVSDDVNYIDAIAVASKFQSIGIATAMLNALFIRHESCIFQLNVNKSNKRAFSVYQRFNFTVDLAKERWVKKPPKTAMTS